MQNKQELLENIELVNTLKVITQAYEEISVMRMQKIRNSVLQTREFLSSIYSIFLDVKRSDKAYREYLGVEGADLSPYALLPENGRTITVYLSANARMNGDIITRVYREFDKYARENLQSDLLIVGKIGKELFDQSKYTRQYYYFEIPDDKVKLDDIKALAMLLMQYQEINIFYGLFENIVMQDPVKSNISGDRPFDPTRLAMKPGDPAMQEKPAEGSETNEENAEGVERKFMYEPSLEELVLFFESQIFSSLLKQTIDESHLSRYASRIKAMEEALGNIDSKSKSLLSESRKLKKSVMNRKQNEALAGMALW